jgi:hypothetical protein
MIEHEVSADEIRLSRRARAEEIFRTKLTPAEQQAVHWLLTEEYMK